MAAETTTPREAAMHDRHNVALAPSPSVWPPDDTEESVLGTNLHQTAILILRTGINEAAAVAVPEGTAVPWQAGGQTMVRRFQHPDGSAYTTLPDVFVYLHPWDDARRSLNVSEDGAPVLVIEVLSKETYENDLDLVRGKGYSYRQAGVREYLTLDPQYRYAPEGGLGWRLDRGEYQPWRRDAGGRWVSRVIPLAFGLEGGRAAVYLPNGHRLLREGEVERTLRERDRQQQQALAEQERLRRVVAEHDRLRQEALEGQERLRRRLADLERQKDAPQRGS
jgi:hypothetical protein